MTRTTRRPAAALDRGLDRGLVNALPLAAWVASAACIALTAAQAQAAAPQERFSLDLEWGAAWQQRNEVQSPNDATGTRFPLDRLTGRGPYAAPRLQLTWPLNPRDDLRLVAAPLRVKKDGTLASAVNYEGETFNAGVTSATYRFDSYRLTWRRTFSESDDWTLKAGVTGKVRDAEITLRQGGTTASRGDLGFVPLLHLYAQRRITDHSRLIFDADGLASSRGRAFDLSLRYSHDLQPGIALFAGARLLDGGANNDSIYNFARFNYFTVGLTFRQF
jgi:hypothetical protein